MTKLIELIVDYAAIEEIKADLYDHIDEENYVNQLDKHNGNTALHYVCEYNSINIEYINLLLAHPKIDVNKTNYNDQTALHFAVLCDNLEAVKLLIKKGIDVKIKTIQGRTALDLAKRYSSPEIIKLLEKASNYLMFNGKKYKLVEEIT